MMTVDKILDWARGRGYTAVYGSAWQINEMLTDVDFAASKDATAVIMHLVTDSATVDGKDSAVVAVYFASLCDFDFDGESLLPEQERLKGIGKDLLNDIRTGNEMTYNDPRWQYGYDDYAENVCWVCLRVTLTASAADCVPLSPEPPTPPPGPEYEYICPQVLHYSSSAGYPNPAFNWRNNRTILTIAIPMEIRTEEGEAFPLVIGHFPTNSWSTMGLGIIDEQYIQTAKNALSSLSDDRKMKPETEKWLRDRLGWECATRHLFSASAQMQEEFQRYMIAGSSALHCEKKEIYYIP